MKIKRLSASAVAMIMSVSLCTVLPSDSYALFESDIDSVYAKSSAAQPVLSLKVNGQSSYEAKPGEAVQLTMEVEGANQRYSTVVLSFTYNKDLIIPDDIFGLPGVYKGDAWESLAFSTPRIGHLSDSDFVFIMGISEGNYGRDGIMVETEFIIPENAKPGTVYPFEFLKIDNDNSTSLFTDKNDTADGKAMQEYAFSHWQNCCVTIAAEDGDVNNDGEVNTADAVILQKWILAAPDVDIDNIKAADLCKDGKIDVFDMIEMRKLIVKAK